MSRRNSVTVSSAGAVAITAVFCVLLWTSVWQLLRVAEHDETIVKMNDVTNTLNHLRAAATEAELGQRGYVLTRKAAFLEPYDAALPTIQHDLQFLRDQVDEADQKARLKELDQALQARLASSSDVVNAAQAGDFNRARNLIATGKDKTLSDRIRALSKEMVDAESSLMRRRMTKAKEVREVNVFFLLLAGGMACWAMVTLIKRINWLQRTMQDIAMHDELTGLLNRRGFVSVADHYLELARRQRLPVALVFADMDGLKKINDTFGHDAGSDAILKLARTLKSAFRKSDLVVRLGGDEFVILATLAANDDGRLMMTRLNKEMDKASGDRSKPYVVSASLGMTLVQPTQRESIAELMEVADADMYRSKQARKAAATAANAASAATKKEAAALGLGSPKDRVIEPVAAKEKTVETVTTKDKTVETAATKEKTVETVATKDKTIETAAAKVKDITTSDALR